MDSAAGCLLKRTVFTCVLASLAYASLSEARTEDDLRRVAATSPIQFESSTQELSFNGYGGASLAGTLQVPRGSGPFPVVVMVGGSGSQIRGGFKLLSDDLIGRGIATFEYDKRGSGKSRGLRIETIPILAADLKAAVALLRQRHDIDGSRVALLGGSQGGAVAPVVAAADPTIRGVVLLAGPMVNGDKAFLDQAIPQMRDANASLSTQRRQVALVKDMLGIVTNTPEEFVRRKKLGTLISAAAQQGLVPSEAVEQIVAAVSDPSLYGEVVTLRPEPILRKVRPPVLALFGANDVLVPSKQNMAVAKMALRNNLDTTIMEIAGANHLFQLGDASFSSIATNSGYPYSAPGLDKIVVPWLSRRLQPTH